MNSLKQGWFRVLAHVAARRWGTWFAKTVFNPLDSLVHRLTGGRFGLLPRQNSLLLRTVGRRSGAIRETPLLYLRDGDSLVVVASNYAHEKHPGWAYNLLARPEATVQIGGETIEVRATELDGSDAEVLWPRLLELYPNWSLYKGWANRRFMIFRLDPIPRC